MKFVRHMLFFVSIAFLTGCSENAVNDIPEDHKTRSRHEFGSLIRGNNAPLKHIMDKNSDSGLHIIKNQSNSTSREKMWVAAINALKDLNFEKLDKENGLIVTESAKIKEFDETLLCNYQIKVIVRNSSFDVTVTSVEDSAIRNTKHAENIKNKISSLIK